MANPFDRFERRDGAANPFDRFDMVPGTVIGAAPAKQDPQPEPEPDFGIDWSMPREDVRRAINLLPPDMKPVAYKQWARSEVGGERKAGKSQDFLYNLTAGTPVGSWLDEGEAALQGGLHKITGGRAGRPYDEVLAIERERQKQAEDNSARLGTVPVPFVGDVEVRGSGLTKLAGGILSAPLSPAINAFRGATMLPRIGNAVATGAGYGAAYGAGEGESMRERARNAAVGAAAGAGIGAVAVPVATGAGRVVEAVRDRAQPLPRQFPRNIERGAVERVSSGATDDQLIPGRYINESPELGPLGTLADMGHNLQSQASAIANQPGAGKRIITDALEGRRAGAANRITGAVDQAIGPPVNVPEFERTFMRRTKAEAKPFYDAFYQTPIPYTDELVSLMHAIPPAAWKKAQELAAMERVSLGDVMNTGRGIDLIKRGIDDIARDAPRGSNVERIASNLARQIRDEVDGLMVRQGVPAPHPTTGRPESVWALARHHAGEGLSAREAIAEGNVAFGTGLSPDQMRMDMARMNVPQTDAYTIGARDWVRSKMGNASAAYGPNADVAVRRALQSEFAREKMRMLTTPERADEVSRTLRAESRFADTEDSVLRNSQTANRLAAQKMYPAGGDAGTRANQIGQKSISGVAMESIYRIANVLSGGAMDERKARIAEQAARMLMAQGVERDTIARGLAQYLANRNLNQRQRQAVTGLLESLATGARPLTVDRMTSDQASHPRR